MRDELAKVIGDNKRRMRAEGEHDKLIIAPTLKVDQFALKCDQFALERDQASAKLEQASAQIDRLVGVVQTLNPKSTKSLKIIDRTPLNEQKT